MLQYGLKTEPQYAIRQYSRNTYLPYVVDHMAVESSVKIMLPVPPLNPALRSLARRLAAASSTAAAAAAEAEPDAAVAAAAAATATTTTAAAAAAEAEPDAAVLVGVAEPLQRLVMRHELVLRDGRRPLRRQRRRWWPRGGRVRRLRRLRRQRRLRRPPLVLPARVRPGQRRLLLLRRPASARKTRRRPRSRLLLLLLLLLLLGLQLQPLQVEHLLLEVPLQLRRLLLPHLQDVLRRLLLRSRCPSTTTRHRRTTTRLLLLLLLLRRLQHALHAHLHVHLLLHPLGVLRLRHERQRLPRHLRDGRARAAWSRSGGRGERDEHLRVCVCGGGA